MLYVKDKIRTYFQNLVGKYCAQYATKVNCILDMGKYLAGRDMGKHLAGKVLADSLLRTELCCN